MTKADPLIRRNLNMQKTAVGQQYGLLMILRSAFGIHKQDPTGPFTVCNYLKLIE